MSGVIVHGSQEENELAVKVCLELVSLCANMSNIRVGATDSALQEVGVFRAICQIILSFFRMPPTTQRQTTSKVINTSRESQPSLHHLTTVLLLQMAVSQLN